MFGRNRTARTPEKTKKWTQAIKWHAKVAMERNGLLIGPIAAKVTAVMPIPKTLAKKHGTAALEGQVVASGKPDLDNILKALFDAVNKVVFKDDSAISEVHALRIYGQNPCLLASFSTIDSVLSQNRSAAA